MAEEIPQIAQIEAWLEGSEHADHDTFSMGREYAAALLEEIRTLRSALVLADGFVVSNTADGPHPMVLADLYNDTCPAAGAIRRAGCWERGEFRAGVDETLVDPPGCFCGGLLAGDGTRHTSAGCMRIP